jgi:hypothetical protein
VPLSPAIAVAFVNVKNLALFLTAIAVQQASDLTVQPKLPGAARYSCG